MVVHEVDVERLTVLEPEDDAPVGPHRNRPKALVIAGQRMKPKGRQLQRLNLLRGLQNRQNLPELSHMIGINAFRKVVLVELTQSLVQKAPNHPSSPKASVNYLFPRVN